MVDKTKLLIQVLKKIPVFDALPPSQVRRLVSLCDARIVKEGEVLCRSDTPADEMYILLAGELAITTAQGLLVATVKPVTTVGEMGVITGQTRSATVTALQPARILALTKASFDGLLETDLVLRVRVLRNFVQILSRKVGDDNIRLRDYESERMRFEVTKSSLESKLRLEERRVEVLVAFVERQSSTTAEEARAAIDAAASLGAPTVLVVDDEQDFRHLVRQALSYCAVREAVDGEQALALLGDGAPDLVITDIRMPGIDGIELVGRIHQAHPQLPVLAVSGYAERRDVEGRGFAGFMEKPLRVWEFRTLVERALAAA